jgi:hypothetical protein
MRRSGAADLDVVEVAGRARRRVAVAVERKRGRGDVLLGERSSWRSATSGSAGASRRGGEEESGGGMRKRRRKARVAGLPSGRFIGGAGASRPSHQAVGDVDSADVRPYEEEGYREEVGFKLELGWSKDDQN